MIAWLVAGRSLYPPATNLAPAAFDPDPSTLGLPPTPGVPAISRAWRCKISTGDPYIAPTVPAVVSIAPCPVRMGSRNSRNHLTWRRRRGHRRRRERRLGMYRCNRKNKGADRDRQSLLHRSSLLGIGTRLRRIGRGSQFS